MLTKELLAYFAGLFDGEGCVTIRGDKGHRSLFVECAIAMTDPESLVLIHEEFGGSFNLRRRHCTNYPIYCWYAKSRKAINFIEAISEYSLVKLPQLLLAIQFQQECIVENKGKVLTCQQLKKREIFREQMKYLKTVKKVIPGIGESR